MEPVVTYGSYLLKKTGLLEFMKIYPLLLFQFKLPSLLWLDFITCVISHPIDGNFT